MSKYEKGQQIPISGIITITGVQQNKAGNFLYSTDRSAVIPEFLIERLEMKPYENPLYATESQPTQPIAPQEDKPTYKVGDRVKVVGGFLNEYIGTITKIDEKAIREDFAPYGIQFAHDWSWKCGTNIEPYTEPEKEPEPVYYSGKVVCVEWAGGCFSEGKVYDIVNGIMRDNFGSRATPTFKTVDDVLRYSGKFIPYLGEA